MTIVAEPLSPVRTPERTTAAPERRDESMAHDRRRIGDLLFRSTATAPLWLVLRLWLGYEWLSAGWEKLHAAGPASWFGHAPALVGFVHGADATWANRAQAFGHPNVHYGWFVDFLDFVGAHGSVFGPIVVFSELLIGLGLLTGTFTRWAALGAVFLNLMYIFGGSAGVNGVFLIAAVLLMCAWQVAGHFGGDRVVPAVRMQVRQRLSR
jgi:thiosulfate dehydrogenase [quinone] large subunit